MEMCKNNNMTIEMVNLASLAMARGLTAAAGSSLTTAAVVYISVQQAVRTTLQRLVLGLTLATAVNLLAMTMQINVGSTTYCAVTGFLVQVTTSVGVVLVIGTVVYLWHVIHNAGQLRHSHITTRTSRNLELTFYLAAIFAPLSLNCVPLIRAHYGRAGAWCWIIGCTTEGLLYQSILGFLPTTLTCLLSTSLVAGISCRYCRWAHRYRLQRQTLLIEAAEVSLLLLYLLCYAIFSIFELAFGVIVRRSIVKLYWLHMTYAITKPLLLALVPLSLLLYLYSTRRAVQKIVMWCSCVKTSSRKKVAGIREKRKLLDKRKGSGLYTSSTVAVTGIDHQPSLTAEEDDPLYSSTYNTPPSVT